MKKFDISLQAIQAYQNYFNPKKLWEVLSKYGNKIGRTTLRQIMVLYYMYVDGLSLKDKLLVIGALGYVICPADFIPDYIPFLGWTDDASAVGFVYNKLKDKATKEVRQKADLKVKEWLGEETEKEELQEIQDILKWQIEREK